MAAACQFEKLTSIAAPHILENIFLSMDHTSFLNCFEVCKTWNDILKSESFKRKARPVFTKDLQKELEHIDWSGNNDWWFGDTKEIIKRIISSGLVG